MSKFLDPNFLPGPTDEEVALAAQLLALNTQVAGRLMGAVARQNREQYYTDFGYTCKNEPLGNLWVERKPAGIPDRPPRGDHGLLFRLEGYPCFYLDQPYGSCIEWMRNIYEFCLKWHLDCDISSATTSWFPGQTLGLTYSIQSSGLAHPYLPD